MIFFISLSCSRGGGGGGAWRSLCVCLSLPAMSETRDLSDMPPRATGVQQRHRTQGLLHCEGLHTVGELPVRPHWGLEPAALWAHFPGEPCSCLPHPVAQGLGWGLPPSLRGVLSAEPLEHIKEEKENHHFSPQPSNVQQLLGFKSWKVHHHLLCDGKNTFPAPSHPHAPSTPATIRRLNVFR